MAITKIWNVTADPGGTLEYIAQDMKSDGKTLVFSGHCSTDWRTADLQMQSHRKRFGKDSGNLLYHGCVSFPKDEVTPERALEYAKEWMEGKFGGYQYFSSVHVDTDKVHFNFAINAVALDGKKYNDCNRTLDELRAWTDEMCLKYNLSIVIPKDIGMSYKEWMEKKNGLSWKEMFRQDIDASIRQSESYEGFLADMKDKGYYMKGGDDHYKHILFCKDGHRVRGGTLSKGADTGYAKEDIKNRIRFKDFHFSYREAIALRKNRRSLSPLQRELRRLKGYRKPTIGTTLALTVHVLAGTIREHKSLIPVWKNKDIQKINELSRQLFFIEANHIASRKDITERVEILKEEYAETLDVVRQAKGLADETGNEEQKRKLEALQKELKQIQEKMKTFAEIIYTLDEIRERCIWSEMARDKEKTKAEQWQETGTRAKKEKQDREV